MEKNYENEPCYEEDYPNLSYDNLNNELNKPEVRINSSDMKFFAQTGYKEGKSWSDNIPQEIDEYIYIYHATEFIKNGVLPGYESPRTKYSAKQKYCERKIRGSNYFTYRYEGIASKRPYGQWPDNDRMQQIEIKVENQPAPTTWVPKTPSNTNIRTTANSFKKFFLKILALILIDV